MASATRASSILRGHARRMPDQLLRGLGTVADALLAQCRQPPRLRPAAATAAGRPTQDPEERDASWEHLRTLADTLTAEELLGLDSETLLHRLYHQEQLRLFDALPIRFRCSCSREPARWSAWARRCPAVGGGAGRFGQHRLPVLQREIHLRRGGCGSAFRRRRRRRAVGYPALIDVRRSGRLPAAAAAGNEAGWTCTRAVNYLAITASYPARRIIWHNRAHFSI